MLIVSWHAFPPVNPSKLPKLIGQASFPIPTLREHKFAVSNLGVIVVHEQALMYLMLMNTVEYLFIDIFCKK